MATTKWIDEPEPSPALRPSAVAVQEDNKGGGYDCDFVDPPADDLLCKICHYPACDPILTVCCGHNFCSTCLERYHQSKVIDHCICPYCRAEKFQTMPDRRTGRYVLNLKVFCPHKHLGCIWIGELRSMEGHVNKNAKSNNKGCPFTELECSNGCGVLIQRRQVEAHLRSQCQLRVVNCEYCNTTGRSQWITDVHHRVCPKYLVQCPNNCKAARMKREEVSRHLEECPLLVVQCPYAKVGCNTVVTRREITDHVTGSVGQHMEYNKTAILDIQNELEGVKKSAQFTEEKLHGKEKELERIKEELEVFKQDLHITRDKLNMKEQTVTSIKKDLQDTKERLNMSLNMQSQLSKAITEKERELNETRKDTADQVQTLHEVIQKMGKRLEETEKSLQHQITMTTPLFASVFGSKWCTELNSFANSSNRVLPVIFKLAEFEKHKKNSGNWDSPGFYTHEGGYLLSLKVFPNGFHTVGAHGSHISIWVPLMKSDHDDHLNWPIKGTLTVQLLNQLSNKNHSEAVEFVFDGSSTNCQRVVTKTVSRSGVWCFQFMPHKKLSYDGDKMCQYLKDDCVFIRVCGFQ